MKKTFGEKLKSLFQKKSAISDDFFEELTDILVEGDIGAKSAFMLVDELEQICTSKKIKEEPVVVAELRQLLLQSVKSVKLEIVPDKTNIWMILGVNGVGKTTSVAKLAKMLSNNGVNNVVLASADTFRAAAIEQLAMHAQKVGVRVISHQHGSDPSAVVFDAAEAVKAKNGGLVLADTAGRLHNKENLVRELQKINKTCTLKSDEGCYKKILVIDATTGQNAVRQAEVFNEAVGVDAIIMTKYDSTAKGGAAITIGRELGIPVAYICTGEKYEDIGIFEPQEYIDDFLGL